MLTAATDTDKKVERDPNRKKSCTVCFKLISASNFSKHRKRCCPSTGIRQAKEKF